jgi:hypothetical protein
MTENENCIIGQFSQEPQEVMKLTKEERLNLLSLKLQELHKENSASKKTHWS